MHRFYLPPDECQAAEVLLHDREAHHAWHVLRLRDGEEVVILDGAGQELRCAVRGRDRDAVRLEVIGRRAIARRSYSITLLQAIPKGKIIEDIIQKATELGAARIVPILSERVVTHLDPASAAAKAAKWQTIAVEAIKQCGNAWLPKVEIPMSPNDFVSRGEQFELPLVGCLEEGSRHPSIWFEEFLREHDRQPRTLCVWVGPEGDFTSAEYQMIKQSGARPITLGPLVLRTETAATYCLSVLNYELSVPD
jgi:16S rRNA (uracil1498-N3)-methyltransferase